MNKEECMELLEQMILELPQYRDITNELCNKYISDYVRKEYESEKEIFTEGNYSSSKDYCWDIYDTVSIEILERILDYFKEMDDKQEQNKQKDKAIDECIELVNQWKDYCKRNIEGNCCDNISIQNNVYLKYCIENLDNLLEKLQQAKGGNDNEC